MPPRPNYSTYQKWRPMLSCACEACMSVDRDVSFIAILCICCANMVVLFSTVQELDLVKFKYRQRCLHLLFM